MSPGGTCHAEASVYLSLSPLAAWNAVTDWDRQSRWMLFTRVWATEHDGVGIGGGVAARTSVGGVGFTDDMVITQWDPPRECTVKHLGTVVQGTGTFAVIPAGVGSTVTWAEDVVPPLGGFGRRGWAVARPVFELTMRMSLRRLVREVAR